MEFKQFAVCKSHRKSLLDVFELGPQPCNMLLWRVQLHGGPNKTLRCSDMAWNGLAWCGILDEWMNGWMDGCRSCNLKRLPVSSCCLLAVVGMFLYTFPGVRCTLPVGPLPVGPLPVDPLPVGPLPGVCCLVFVASLRKGNRNYCSAVKFQSFDVDWQLSGRDGCVWWAASLHLSRIPGMETDELPLRDIYQDLAGCV